MNIPKDKFQAIFTQLLQSGNPELIALQTKYKNQPEILQMVLSDVIEEIYKEMNPFKWEPVDTKTFLEDPYYCGVNQLTDEGVSKTMFPKLKDDFCKIHTPEFKYREVISTGGIGVGKSFFMSLGLVWHLYFVSCLKLPQKYLKISVASKIAIMILSITEKQAKKNMFSTVKEMITKIPYFQENFFFDKKRASDSLIFPNNLEVFSGTSTQSSTIGLNVFSAALDEANFFKVIEQSKRSRSSDGEFDEALTLYFSLVRRQETRFMKQGVKPGVLYLGSSKVYPNDFTAKRIQAARENQSLSTYVMDYNRWNVDPDSYSKETFTVELGGISKRNRILNGTETDVTGELLQVPIDFLDGFKKDLDNAIRDIAGIALYSVQPFFGEREKIQNMFDQTLPRVFSVDDATLSPKSEYILKERIIKHEILNKSHVRYVGIDVGIKKDRYGFAMGHVESIQYVEKEVYNDMLGQKEILRERRPFIVIDLLLRVKPEVEFGEVELARVRSLILNLKKFGYKIKFASSDGYESTDTKQVLKRSGITFDTFQMGIKRSLEPYETFRSALYEGRIRSVYHPVLEDEMICLEKNYINNTVDHKPTGSKDLSDAVCQVVYNCHINMQYQDDTLLPMAPEQTQEKTEQTLEQILEDFNKWAKETK